MNIRILLPLTAALLCGCSAKPQVSVEDAVVHLGANGQPSEAYFTLRANKGPLKLLRITSPQASQITFQEIEDVEGADRMNDVSDATFENNVVAFDVGRRRAALTGLDGAVQPGGTITLTFDFDNADDVTSQVPVEAQH